MLQLLWCFGRCHCWSCSKNVLALHFQAFHFPYNVEFDHVPLNCFSNKKVKLNYIGFHFYVPLTVQKIVTVSNPPSISFLFHFLKQLFFRNRKTSCFAGLIRGQWWKTKGKRSGEIFHLSIANFPDRSFWMGIQWRIKALHYCNSSPTPFYVYHEAPQYTKGTRLATTFWPIPWIL